MGVGGACRGQLLGVGDDRGDGDLEMDPGCILQDG